MECENICPQFKLLEPTDEGLSDKINPRHLSKWPIGVLHLKTTVENNHHLSLNRFIYQLTNKAVNNITLFLSALRSHVYHIDLILHPFP